MKEETRIKTLRTFYYLGMVLFVIGIVLVFVYNRIYAGWYYVNRHHVVIYWL